MRGWIRSLVVAGSIAVEFCALWAGEAIIRPAGAAQPGAQRPYLRNTEFDEAAAQGDGTRSAGSGEEVAASRVAGGAPAPAGQWPSMVALMVRTRDGHDKAFCGATLIDAHWALTAGHCLRHVRKDGTPADVDPARIFVREGTNDLGKGGRDLPVQSLLVHPEFDRRTMRNDIALVRLGRRAHSPRQLLGPGASAVVLLRPGRQGTIMGYGITTPIPTDGTRDRDRHRPSSVLLDAEVPIIAKQKCVDGYRVRGKVFELNTGATYCAGYDHGGIDSCPGDSGGPMLVRDEVGQAVQVGVVSYGLGCAQPNAWGIYASVPHFEGWIRQYVPNASFAAAASTASPTAPDHGALQQLVAGLVASAPGSTGQITVDVLPGEEVRQGQPLVVQVTSALPGSLVLYARDAGGGVAQLFPHGRSRGSEPGQTPRRMRAGATLSVPTSGYDGFVLRASGQPGVNEVIAVVVDERVDIADLTRPYEGFRSVPDPAATIGAITRRLRDLSVEPRSVDPVRAVAVRRFRVLSKL